MKRSSPGNFHEKARRPRGGSLLTSHCNIDKIITKQIPKGFIRMKKLISVLLTLVMPEGAAATVFSAGEGDFPFTDVPAKKWYRKAVE